MPEITLDLIRKHAEHNEGMVSSLEELTLHQEEIERINGVLQRHCKELKILYLQNNIISRLENLSGLHRLEYLNLALNNVSRVEGLSGCEFLNKLDLTINFIDLDELRASVEHLAGLEHLEDLYLMGNPAQTNWDGFTEYVVAKLPQLGRLDGQEITRSQRIVAEQKLARLEAELEGLAAGVRARRAEEAPAAAAAAAAPGGADEMTQHTPEVRTAMYREIAEEKAEKARREEAMQPKKRDSAAEHRDAVSAARAKEEAAAAAAEGALPRQCNQGGWDFRIDEVGGRGGEGAVLLDVAVPRHLDSSLIDVDVHPRYVSLVIKNKKLLLHLPAEVTSAHSSAQRSKTTGHLAVRMPKVDPGENAVALRAARRAHEDARAAQEAAQRGRREREAARRARNRTTGARMLAAAAGDESASEEEAEGPGAGEAARGAAGRARPTAPVRLDGLVPRRFGGVGGAAPAEMSAVSTAARR